MRADDRVARAHERALVHVDRPRAVFQLAREAVVHALELALLRLAQVEVAEDSPEREQDRANDHVLALAQPADEDRGVATRDAIRQQEVELLLLCDAFNN